MPPIHPKKSLGQHFLRDSNVIDQIIRHIAPKEDDHVVEIGPGLGALTEALLPHVGQLDAIELDERMIEPLRRRAERYQDKFRIFHQDALKLQLVDLLQGPARDSGMCTMVRVVGNLPYNISTPLLAHLLTQLPYIKDMHIMLQREVACRLLARPRQKHYGRLSLMVQPACQVVSLMDVAPESFSPPPKVYSMVVRLLPYRTPIVQIQSLTLFSKVVKVAFGQRRKTLRQSLRSLISADELKKLHIEPTARAEQLSLEQFVVLSNWLYQTGLTL